MSFRFIAKQNANAIDEFQTQKISSIESHLTDKQHDEKKNAIATELGEKKIPSNALSKHFNVYTMRAQKMHRSESFGRDLFIVFL